LSADSKQILKPSREKLDGTLLFPVVVGKPIETGCSQRKIHITALVLKIRSPGFARHSLLIRLRLREFAAGILCFAALGKDATGRLKSSRFRSSCANARFARLRPLGIHEAEHQAFGFSGG
jgi:hypothetical protein